MGWEHVGAIGAAALALVGAGAGRISIDGLLGRRHHDDDTVAVDHRATSDATRA